MGPGREERGGGGPGCVCEMGKPRGPWRRRIGIIMGGRLLYKRRATSTHTHTCTLLTLSPSCTVPPVSNPSRRGLRECARRGTPDPSFIRNLQCIGSLDCRKQDDIKPEGGAVPCALTCASISRCSSSAALASSCPLEFDSSARAASSSATWPSRPEITACSSDACHCEWSRDSSEAAAAACAVAVRCGVCGVVGAGWGWLVNGEQWWVVGGW